MSASAISGSVVDAAFDLRLCLAWITRRRVGPTSTPHETPPYPIHARGDHRTANATRQSFS